MFVVTNAAGARADLRAWKAMQRAKRARELAELQARQFRIRQLQGSKTEKLPPKHAAENLNGPKGSPPQQNHTKTS